WSERKPVVDADLAEEFGPAVERLTGREQAAVIGGVVMMQGLRNSNKAMEKMIERVDALSTTWTSKAPAKTLTFDTSAVEHRMVEVLALPAPSTEEVLALCHGEIERLEALETEVVHYTDVEIKAIRRKAMGRAYVALAKYGTNIMDDDIEINIEQRNDYWRCVYIVIDGVKLGMVNFKTDDEIYQWLDNTKLSGKVFREAVKHVNLGGTDTELHDTYYVDSDEALFNTEDGLGSVETDMPFLTKAEIKAANKIWDTGYEDDCEWQVFGAIHKLNQRVGKRLLKKAKQPTYLGVEVVYGKHFDSWLNMDTDTTATFTLNADGSVKFEKGNDGYYFTDKTTEANAREYGGDEGVAELAVWKDKQLAAAQEGPAPF
ncbi:MAG: hypothetical protein ACRCZ2_01240, partial [Fusobacteriaceae bacterium]